MVGEFEFLIIFCGCTVLYVFILIIEYALVYFILEKLEKRGKKQERCCLAKQLKYFNWKTFSFFKFQIFFH